MSARLLIAGIGNIFLGDDAFGVEVVQRLLARPWPNEVRVIDFGIRGLDLAYALVEGYEAVILIDAAPRGGAAGTLYVIEPDEGNWQADGSSSTESTSLDMHGMDPVRVLRLAQSLGGKLPRVLLVGCEPQPLAGPDDAPMELSAAVRAAVPAAVELVASLADKLLGSVHEPACIASHFPVDEMKGVTS